jgi:hypothetical protein
MKNRRVHSLICGIFLLCVCVGYAAIANAQNDPLADLETRIEKLEQQLALKQEFVKLSEQFAALSEEMDDTVLSERLKSLEQHYQQALQELETISLAQLELKIKNLKERLKSHEELADVAKELREDTISQRFEIIEQKYAQAVQKYNQSIQALQIEQDTFKNEVTDANNTFKNDVTKANNDFTKDVAHKNRIIYAVWGVMTLLGVWVLIETFYMIPKRIKKEMHEEVAQIFTTERETIEQLVRAQEIDSQIKARTRLLLLSDKKDELEKIQVQFQLMGFPHVQSRLYEEAFDLKQQVLKLDESQYDLVVFNQLSIEQINAYVDKSAFDAFAGYTFKYLDPKLLTHRERLNFGQSPFTLYARTMEVLRYQALFKK